VSARGWTRFEIVAVCVAAFGTLPFAFLLTDLLTSPGTVVGSSLGSWEGAAVFGGIAFVGWSLLVRARQLAKRAVRARSGQNPAR
jgi:hypothetical protein